MGYELRRWLADRLPDDVSSGERLVALEIADQAHETTRLAYGKDLMDVVTRRTGYSDAKQIGRVLEKLAAHGVELRVPVTDKDGNPVTDKRGRKLFAFKGHALRLRVPLQKDCPALKLPRPGELSESSPAEGSKEPQRSPARGSNDAQRSPARSPKVPRSGDPTTHTTQQAGQPGPSTRHAYGIPDAARPLVDGLTAAGVVVRWPFKGNGWFPVLSLIQKAGVEAMTRHAVRAAKRADVVTAAYFMEGWAELPPLVAPAPQPAPQPASRPAAPPHCGHIDCDPVTRTRETEDDNGITTNYRCPDCHPNATRSAA